MKGICENIYKKSRKNAGLEQPEAAEQLGVGLRSFQNYDSELNHSVPQLDVLRIMCILYKDRSLAYKHLKKSPIAEFLPDLEQQPLSLATLSVVDDLNSAQDLISTLVKITRDGKIDAEEQADWDKIMHAMSRLMNSISALRNAEQGET